MFPVKKDTGSFTSNPKCIIIIIFIETDKNIGVKSSVRVEVKQ